MDDIAKAIAAIEERRNAAPGTLLTKDQAPEPITKADAESGVLTGYASRFGVVDSYGEATLPGAFATSIRDRGPDTATPRIHLRLEHETTIGRHLSMVEDADGLKVEALISDDGLWGSAVRAHLRDGVPYGMSIGFRRVRERPATADDPLNFDTAPSFIVELAKQDIGNITVLTEVKLLENSVVTFPANDLSLVTNYRSDVLDLTQRHIDALLRDAKAGRLTADHITHLRALAQTLPAASDPDGEMPAPVAPQTAVTRRNYAAELHYALARHGLTDLEIRQ